MLGGNTASTYVQDQSYAPLNYKAHQEVRQYSNYSSVATTLLPAAKMKFALVSSVPKDTESKALVFVFSIILTTSRAKAPTFEFRCDSSNTKTRRESSTRFVARFCFHFFMFPLRCLWIFRLVWPVPSAYRNHQSRCLLLTHPDSLVPDGEETAERPQQSSQFEGLAEITMG